jgi:flagellar motor protein MotB
MAKKATCRCKKAECEECPEWIFTFADLVMLMMGFFVILWVLKPSPTPKSAEAAQAKEDMIKLAAAIRESFGYIPKLGSGDPVDREMLMSKLSQPKTPDGPGAGGKTRLRPDGAHGTDPEVQSIRPGEQTLVGGRIMFEKGESQLLPRSMTALDEIADKIRGHRTVVLIMGHTALDDLPDTATAEQKLDLSLRRAQTVSDYLTAHAVEPDILRVVGCSIFEPVVERDYEPDSQFRNRRVEVESTNTPVLSLQDPAKPTTVPSEVLEPKPEQ